MRTNSPTLTHHSRAHISTHASPQSRAHMQPLRNDRRRQTGQREAQAHAAPTRTLPRTHVPHKQTLPPRPKRARPQLPRRHAVSHAAPSTALEHTIPSRSLFPSCPCTPTLLDPCSPRRTLAHSFRHILARSAPTYSTLACSTSRSLTASWLAGARWPPSAISQRSLACCLIRLLSRSLSRPARLPRSQASYQAV